MVDIRVKFYTEFSMFTNTVQNNHVVLFARKCITWRVQFFSFFKASNHKISKKLNKTTFHWMRIIIFRKRSKYNPRF
jgi:hypothetical protein